MKSTLKLCALAAALLATATARAQGATSDSPYSPAGEGVPSGRSSSLATRGEDSPSHHAPALYTEDVAGHGAGAGGGPDAPAPRQDVQIEANKAINNTVDGRPGA